MKKGYQIRLTEEEFNQVIAESVVRVLNEGGVFNSLWQGVKSGIKNGSIRQGYNTYNNYQSSNYSNIANHQKASIDKDLNRVQWYANNAVSNKAELDKAITNGDRDRSNKLLGWINTDGEQISNFSKSASKQAQQYFKSQNQVNKYNKRGNINQTGIVVNGSNNTPKNNEQ